MFSDFDMKNVTANAQQCQSVELPHYDGMSTFDKAEKTESTQTNVPSKSARSIGCNRRGAVLTDAAC